MPKLPIITKHSSEKTQISGKAKSLVDTLVATGCTITEASKVAGTKVIQLELVLQGCYENLRYKHT